jgi:structural maintenance of chromosome 4
MSFEEKSKVLEFENLIRENSPEFEQLLRNVNEAEERVKTLENEISERISGKMKEQKKAVEKLQNAKDEISKKIARSTAKISSLKTSIEKSETQKQEQAKAVKDTSGLLESKIPELTMLKEQKEKLQEELQLLQRQLDSDISSLEELQAKLALCKEELRSLRLQRSEVKDAFRKFQADFLTIERDLDNLQKRLERAGVDETQIRDAKEIEIEIAFVKKQLDEMDPNMGAIEEYQRRNGLYESQKSEYEKITLVRDQQFAKAEDFRVQRSEMFLNGFSQISQRLKQTYQMITLGGDAELDCVDIQNPFSEGILFTVRPPGKGWKKMSNLSGGEKTLSSLALVFALHQFKPSPLYILDEIDAALDFTNVSIIANYLKERTTNSQFIVVSLRNNMFEMADKLVGIVKMEDCTSSLSITPKWFLNETVEEDCQL